jgi:hypothetical protein
MVDELRTPDLHLPWMPRFDGFKAAKLIFERGTVPHYAKGVEHLRDAVVFGRVSSDA